MPSIIEPDSKLSFGQAFQGGYSRNLSTFLRIWSAYTRRGRWSLQVAGSLIMFPHLDTDLGGITDQDLPKTVWASCLECLIHDKVADLQFLYALRSATASLVWFPRLTLVLDHLYLIIASCSWPRLAKFTMFRNSAMYLPGRSIPRKNFVVADIKSAWLTPP